METRLFLVRHAQAQPLTHQTEPEWALSARGEQQAIALVPILTALGIQHVYTSPFRRSCDTLRPFARAAGLELRIDEGLRERCLSSRWIGDFREVWQRSWADFTYALEDGESSAVCRDRMAAAVEQLARRHRGEAIAIGSHGFSIGLFLTTIDPDFGGEQASALRTPEILKVDYDGTAFQWDRSFSTGEAFDRIATHFRSTPGIVA